MISLSKCTLCSRNSGVTATGTALQHQQKTQSLHVDSPQQSSHSLINSVAKAEPTESISANTTNRAIVRLLFVNIINPYTLVNITSLSDFSSPSIIFPEISRCSFLEHLTIDNSRPFSYFFTAIILQGKPPHYLFGVPSLEISSLGEALCTRRYALLSSPCS